MTRIEINVLCADRNACPAIISEMMDLGFSDVKEVFNKADADITARLEYKGKDEFDKKFSILFEKTREKITQISYNE